MKLKVLVVFLAILVSFGCSGVEESKDPLLHDLTITEFSPKDILNGSIIKIQGDGFVKKNLGDIFVSFIGDQNGETIEFTVQPLVVSATELFFPVAAEILSQFQIDSGPFYGDVIVERILYGGSRSSASMYVELNIVSKLSPSISTLYPQEVYPEETLFIDGENFLMNQEGLSLVKFNGTLTSENGYSVKAIDNLYIPGKASSRSQLEVILTPDVFGIEPATFAGTVSVVNNTENNTEISELFSNELTNVTLKMGRTYLEQIYPDKVRRGQKVTGKGRGFLSTEVSLQTVTVITFEGEFTSKGQSLHVYTDKNPFIFLPDNITGNNIFEYVLRVSIGIDKKIQGVGLVPGHLIGIFTPWIIYGDKTSKGVSITQDIEILPQLQIVFVKFLPGFEGTLEKFGLREVGYLIKQRIFTVIRNDYTGISMDFREERPTDFIEYSVIEVMGADPNKAGLLGLDNSSGKDTGNLIFDDVIGGYNAESEEEGFYAYGGVFTESFIQFSPALSEGKTGLASQTFDEIFLPFMPSLGGTPIQMDEYPGSLRDEAIELSITTLGNIIADTITHETGHSLGLATDSEGEFHNVGDNPGWIMDAGSFRTFEERAQLSDGLPRVFAPHDLQYLKSVLPVE